MHIEAGGFHGKLKMNIKVHTIKHMVFVIKHTNVLLHLTLGKKKSSLNFDEEVARVTFETVIKVEKEKVKLILPPSRLSLHWHTLMLIITLMVLVESPSEGKQWSPN
jgi:hypothetical protein